MRLNTFSPFKNLIQPILITTLLRYLQGGSWYLSLCQHTTRSQEIWTEPQVPLVEPFLAVYRTSSAHFVNFPRILSTSRKLRNPERGPR